MLSHLRIAPIRLQACSRVSPTLCARRSISHTLSTRSELAPEPPSEADLADPLENLFQKPEATPEEEGRQPETYNEFMNSIGENFRKADAPTKWLGGAPFPMNPSFKPPPPVSDTIRTTIYQSYMSDPIANNIRVLSQRYHLSLKRVDAILRLKGMENDWVKGKPLQTGFLKGMEMILAVPPRNIDTPVPQLRTDAHEADELEQAENRDAARQRYQQLYWESVPEDGREPIVPASLEHAKAAAKRYAKAQEAYKSNPKLMPRVQDHTTQRPREKVQVIEKTGRPSLKFVDVGGHFIEVDSRLKRIAESERRSKIKARKHEEKLAAALERKAARSE
ncbi:hypothetical protein H0H81_004529 [Sphagnurus paluster]|uniref:Uncharacterized protein n=1 Tax=Sphagnurus paluster TaxID=117069 RepID=A0A9P7GL05_9AGAR|nr:hypothetical protein H0H81_004529 [Sphagnurus paluster]